mgnify:CR=1 FL=1
MSCWLASPAEVELGAACAKVSASTLFLRTVVFFFFPPSTYWGLAFTGASTVVVGADDEEGEDVVAKGDFAGGVADFAGVGVAGFGDEGAMGEEAGSSEVG